MQITVTVAETDGVVMVDVSELPRSEGPLSSLSAAE